MTEIREGRPTRSGAHSRPDNGAVLSKISNPNRSKSDIFSTTQDG